MRENPCPEGCAELGLHKTQTSERMLVMEDKLDEILADMTAIKEMLEAWNSAKGFVTGVRVIGTVLRFLAYTVAAGAAVWIFIKTGQVTK